MGAGARHDHPICRGTLGCLTAEIPGGELVRPGDGVEDAWGPGAAHEPGRVGTEERCEAPVVAEVPAPGTAGKLKLYDVNPKTAAMIMAIVADKMGKPLNELRFISIKEVK